MSGVPPPEMSVVIAAFSGAAALSRCLDSLASQSSGVEVIVATDRPPAEVEPLRRQHPAVRFVFAPPDSGVFRLRSLGLAESRGRLVGLTEDHCTLAPTWVSGLRRAAASGRWVLGGPVESGHAGGGYLWALYLSEYANFLPPLADGPAAYVSGVNVAYAGDALRACRPLWREEFHDPLVLDALRAAGYRCRLVPEAGVRTSLRLSPPAAVAHLFGGGRWYGRFRKERVGRGRRLLLALAAPLIPAVMLARVVRLVAARRPAALPATVAGLAFLSVLLLAWGAGEAVSYWFAAPGRAGAASGGS
jgi:glycosyltransferase involved in cell wall biosynthesis